MLKLLQTQVGWLRIVGFLEGVSLLLLLGIAVPLKYIYGNPALVKSVGLVHGILFVFFVLNALMVGIAQNWKFFTTLKVMASSLVPFGTFYIDKTMLSKIEKWDWLVI